ncbi:hypothetical protein [Flavobacterium alkalisoli]|uniref:hypothetical protein n=1 Tax=Flavobacterium alkalisoli TaxID=2602769 RepID=UPI003A8F9D58
MRKFYFLSTFVILLATTSIVISCGSDDKESYTEIPDESPVVLDLDAVPYPKLSDYNFFEGEMKNLEPVFRVIPYDLNSTLFTDYAKKKRFIWMPAGVKASYESDSSPLNFPTGTVLIKNFYYDNLLPDNTTKIIETRLMIKKADGWMFANYVWNDEQTEAVYNVLEATQQLTWNENGIEKSTEYQIPALDQCLTCHGSNEVATPIGPKPQNINKLFNYGEGTQNQLQKWISTGYLENNLPQQIVSTVDWKDTSLPLDIRAKSYLDINCAHCHTPGGFCDYTDMNFAFNASNDLTNLGKCIEPQDFVVGNEVYLLAPGNSDISLVYTRMKSESMEMRMPLLGRTIRDEEGVELIKAWINSMPRDCE